MGAKTILITGGARGIGRACVVYFAKQGWQVMLNYHRSGEQAAALENELCLQGYTVRRYQADVSDDAQAGAMISKGIADFGSIDVLVNNAGISQQKLFCDISPQEWNAMIGVHLNGTFFCCRHVLRDMIQRKSGSIINVSSIWGITGASCEVHYSAAKAGIIGLTKALAKEVGPSNIRVNCVAPGVVATEMNENLSEADVEELKQQTPLCRIGSAEEIARTIGFLASDEASFLTGQVISPNGGIVI